MFGLFNKSNKEEIANLVKNGAFLVDVRTPQEFAGGSAANAVNIPLSILDVRMNELEGKESIVLFCKSGGRSGQAESFLKSKGFTNVHNGGTWKDIKAMQ